METLYIVTVAIWVLGYGSYISYSTEEGIYPVRKIQIFSFGTLILLIVGINFFPQLFSSF